MCPKTPFLVNGSPLKNSVEISDVTGGKKTDPMWISEVSNEDFSSALRLSLKQHTMLSEANGPLVLTTGGFRREAQRDQANLI
jgi:hypothetical protein